MNFYILYFLTLISSYGICWTFGTMLTIAAGVDYIPMISFLSSIFQFGIGSWLFLFVPKIGRVVAIILGIAMLVWPFASIPWIIREREIWGYLFYGLPILLNSIIIYCHLMNFKSDLRPRLWIRVFMAIIPSGLFIWYLFKLAQ